MSQIPMPEFLDKTGQKWFPLNLKNKIPQPIKHSSYYSIRTNKDGEEYISYTPDYNDFKTLSDKQLKERQKLVNDYDYIAIDTTKYQQLDLDSEYTKEEYMKYDKIKNAPYFLSVNKKLPHFFIKLDDNSELLNKKNNRKTPNKNNNLDYDVLCGQWSYTGSKVIVYGNLDIPNIDLEEEKILFKDLLNTKKEDKPNKEDKPKKQLKKKDEKEEEKEEEDDIKKYAKDKYKEKKEENKKIKDKKDKVFKKRTLKEVKNILDKLINKDDTKLNEMKEYLECLNAERFENYENYFKLTTIIKRTYGDIAFEAYDAICSQYKRYDREGNMKLWKEVDINTITIGTLLYWCKEDDKNKYNEIILNKYQNLQITDKFICEILAQITDNIIFKNDELYVFNGHDIWLTGESAKNKFKDIIDNDLYDYIKIHIICCFDNNELKGLLTQLKRITTQKGKEDIIKTAKQPQFGFNKDYDDKINFDNNWFYFPMKTKVYDLEQEKFIEYSKYMYITKKTNYDYIEKTKDNTKVEEAKEKEFDILLNKIFPDPNIKEKFLMICSTGLESRVRSKVHIFTGTGGNGKSLLMNYLSKVLDIFYHAGNNNIIIENGKKDETTISNMTQSRLIVFTEPSKKKELDVSKLKELTGEKEINARKIYSTNTKNINNGTYIILCNTIPLLSETPDNAVKRRFDITPFISTFTTDKSLVDEKNNIYEANITYEHKEEYFKNTFLKFLIEAHKEYKKNSYEYKKIEECDKKINKYYEKSNFILQFFNETYQLTENENETVSIKEIYDTFREHDIYRNFSKEDKRIHNRTSIIEFIEQDIKYKARYGLNDKNNAILRKIKLI